MFSEVMGKKPNVSTAKITDAAYGYGFSSWRDPLTERLPMRNYRKGTSAVYADGR